MSIYFNTSFSFKFNYDEKSKANVFFEAKTKTAEGLGKNIQS